MRTSIAVVLAAARIAVAHGDHGKPAAGENMADYALRHMATEHHIDTFDPMSFFHLHDFNRDGQLDKDEIEAIYGVHHPYSQKKSADEAAHSAKAEHIVRTVLDIMDTNKDGKISIEEFSKAGVRAFPSFEDLGAEGHHYDVESEFFLHHEEEFHSTPDTQTDESYTHPEDLEHFAQHAEIERQEVIREAVFQGISVEEALAEHEEAEAAAAHAVEERNKEDVERLANDQQVPLQGEPGVEADAQKVPPKPRYTRVPSPGEVDPSEAYKTAHAEGAAAGEWGSGESGYKVPKTPGERMRKNVPYKYKFRRNWGDF